MALINDRLLSVIENIVLNIERDYRRSQGLILTEDDLKCLIYGKLRCLFRNRIRQHPYLQQENQGEYLPAWESETVDRGIFASPVHCEVTWFDENNKLRIKPDITILEPQWLSILNFSGDRLPEKQFTFGGQGILFELTFVRGSKGVDLSRLRKIKEDVRKITRLNNRLTEKGMPNSIYCYIIVFCKTNSTCPEFDKFLSEKHGDWFKIIYASGGVDPNRILA